ncbi:MAG: HAD family hydrolase [Chloroflexota bacterium]
MALIQIKDKMFEDIQLIICDKDGTLTNFNVMWSNWIKSWIDGLIAHASQEVSSLDTLKLTAEMDRTLGFDRPNMTVKPESPVAVSTLEKIAMAAMVVLYQNGVNWHHAQDMVEWIASQPAEITADLVQPVGDVKTAFEQWSAAGITIIVATSDNREFTVPALHHLDVTHLVAELYCGDDPVPNKPNPTAIELMCSKYGLQPHNILMVGDSVSDMAFGRNGNIAGCIGILGGSGSTEDLEQSADVVVYSVDKMLIA